MGKNSGETSCVEAPQATLSRLHRSSPARRPGSNGEVGTVEQCNLAGLGDRGSTPARAISSPVDGIDDDRRRRESASLRGNRLGERAVRLLNCTSRSKLRTQTSSPGTGAWIDLSRRPRCVSRAVGAHLGLSDTTTPVRTGQVPRRGRVLETADALTWSTSTRPTQRARRAVAVRVLAARLFLEPDARQAERHASASPVSDVDLALEVDRNVLVPTLSRSRIISDVGSTGHPPCCGATAWLTRSRSTAFSASAWSEARD